ncbi:MAG: hypothetical protein II034_03900, partial [Muribaculaceae bacterium]|nr:hypothetical protein [Muribaculaceae bacterium]
HTLAKKTTLTKLVARSDATIISHKAGGTQSRALGARGSFFCRPDGANGWWVLCYRGSAFGYTPAYYLPPLTGLCKPHG